MRLVFFIVICVFVAADILMAQELWGLMKSKGMIREEVLANLTVTKIIEAVNIWNALIWPLKHCM